MDEAFSRPSLVDDPVFLARIEDLDRGLIDSSIPVHPPVKPVAFAAAEPLPAASAADAPIVLQPGTHRPLHDLFPPAPTATLQPIPAALTRGTAVAPRLAHPVRVAAPTVAATPPVPRTDEMFYGFAEPAFGLAPDLRFLYHSAEHDRVMQQIVDAVARRDGLVVVTGAAGIGKTLLCRALADQIDRRTLTSVVSAPNGTFDDLVQTLLADFGVLSREELARAGDAAGREKSLRSFVASLAALQANAVIVVDDAQDASADVLVALDRLAADMPRTLQIVLAGSPSLARLLERPELDLVAAHVTQRLTLGPLAADEVPGYVMHRVQIAAASPRIEFDDGALARVFEISQGVPRVVNQLCDRALARAFETAATVVDAATIGLAAADLDVAPPAASRDSLRAFALGAGFVLLMAGGASVSVLLFWSRVQLILAH